MPHFTYINGSQVSFRKDVMVVTFVSNKRFAELNPTNRPNGRYGYELSYNPATGNAVNGVSTKQIVWTPELTGFIKSLTGGVSFAAEYTKAFALNTKTQQVLHRENRNNHIDTDTDEVMRERY